MGTGFTWRWSLYLTLTASLLSCSRGSGRASIQAVTLPNEVEGDVPIQVTLASDTTKSLDVTIEVSTDRQTWSPATLAEGSTTAGLSSGPGGSSYVFTWDSLRDLGFRISGDTWIKITATDSGGLVDIQEQKIERVSNLLPASKRVRNYMIYFGAWDTAKVRTAETHDLVILYPGQTSVTRALVADIQDGVNASDPRDDCIVLAYLNIGEDERTIGLTDQQLLADARFVGDGLGPRVDPRGPNSGGLSLADVDLRGAPSASGGYASFYLDDNDVEAFGVGDGRPDRNGVTGACYVNAGSDAWFEVVHEMQRSAGGLGGMRECLTKDYGASLLCDGVYLDNIDTVAPNSFTAPGQPDHATFEWTAPGMTKFMGEVRRRYPKQVIMQNRGLFFFDPRYPHYHFATGPLIDYLKIENYRLDSDPSRDFDAYAFAENKHNLLPRLMAEAQRFTFQILSLGYAEGPGIDPNTLLGTATTGLTTLLDDVREAELMGMRHYLTNAAGDLVNDFARRNGIANDTVAPVWASSYNALAAQSPPGAPTPRVGLQQVEVAPGALTVRWDVAIDRSPVTYVLYFSPTQIRFDRNGMPVSTYQQELYPARVPEGYTQGPGVAVFPFEATSGGLVRNQQYWFCLFARDSNNNWAKNTVVFTARAQ